MNRILLILLALVLQDHGPPYALPAVQNCMQCFEEDLGDGWIAYGCEVTSGQGTDYCTITVSPQGCEHNAACSDGAVIVGPPIPPGWLTPMPAMGMPGIDQALHSRSLAELQYAMPFLIEYTQLVQAGAQRDELMSVKWQDDGISWVRMTADLAMYRVHYDGARLQFQQLLMSVPEKPTIIGFSLTREKGLEVLVAFPEDDGQRMGVSAWSVKSDDGDGMGTLPAKAPKDDVGTLPDK